MSKIEERVIEKIRTRAKAGFDKYGVTMERDDLSTLEWLQHAQDEALDHSIYLEKLIDIEKTKMSVIEQNITWLKKYIDNVPLYELWEFNQEVIGTLGDIDTDDVSIDKARRKAYTKIFGCGPAE